MTPQNITEKRSRKILNHSKVEISIYKAGKGEPFHWKVMPCAHSDSLSEVRWQNDEYGTYISTNYFIPLRIQFFWLWFVIDLRIKKERLSVMRMVRYEDTHYSSIDDALK